MKAVQLSYRATRRLQTYHIFALSLAAGVMFGHLVLTVRYYWFYLPIIPIAMVIGPAASGCGDFIGRILSSRVRPFRRVAITAGLVAAAISILLLGRDIILPAVADPIVSTVIAGRWILPVITVAASLLFGITFHYSLRVSCLRLGRGMPVTQGLVGILTAGIAVGMSASLACYAFAVPSFVVIPLICMPIPSLIFINLPHQETTRRIIDDEEDDREGTRVHDRGSSVAWQWYINAASAAVYACLGHAVLARFFGAAAETTAIYMVLICAASAVGYAIGEVTRKADVNRYGPAFLPLAFLVFYVCTMMWGDELGIAAGFGFLIPVSLLSGAILSHSARGIVEIPDHERRVTLYEFAIVAIPVSIITALGFVTFTNFWFHALLAAVMIGNVVLPFVRASGESRNLRRMALPFSFAVAFVPLLVFTLVYFRVPLDSALYAPRAGNFNELKNIDYDADYIPGRTVVTLDGVPVFSVSDSETRNYKRALVPLAIHMRDGGSVLFIDGTQRFFRNPVIGAFPGAVCIDPLHDNEVDYQRLPLSAEQRYVADTGDVLSVLAGNKHRYAAIVDIPNFLDQDRNPFRFSEAYQRLVKHRLEKDGVFAQVFHVSACRPEFFISALKNAETCFRRQAIYLFSNIALLVCADSDRAFTVNQERYASFIRFLNAHEEMNDLFLNETHALSHLAAVKTSDLLSLLNGAETFQPYKAMVGEKRQPLTQSVYESWIKNNGLVLGLVDPRPEELVLRQTIANEIITNGPILTLLKQTERAEAEERYGEETAFLFELKRQAEFRIPLQDYVRRMLRYKEKYYYAAAIRMERKRRWDEARELYLAVKGINPDNFEAHYRLGLLSLTLQDVEGAARYFGEAMRINPNHPKLMLQMGILHVARGEYAKAAEYFNRVIQMKENVTVAYRYIGICHERLGNLYDAERYYVKAVEADPADVESKSRLAIVREKIGQERKKWEAPERKNELEAEQDAEMPLPVSRGAYEIRLKDDDTSLPVLDPVTGEEVKTDHTRTPDAGGGPNQP